MSTLAREKIPAHLPDRLAIAFWEWMWFTDTQPGEPFHDMENCFRELVERGFNAIRIDAMLGWIYDKALERRGAVRVGRVAKPGTSHYGPAMTTRGGFSADAFVKLEELFQLARKYDVYVALTTWEYNDGHSTTFCGDPAIIEEIHSIPKNERFLFVARQYERLLRELALYDGLLDRIAYVEVHNEADMSSAFEQPGDYKGKMEEALAYLQARFPGILTCSDRVIPGYKPDGYGYDYDAMRTFVDGFADNDQAIDHHLYALGVEDALFEKTGLNFLSHDGDDIDERMRETERSNEFLRWLMKPDFEPWDAFREHFDYPTNWRKFIYLYENLDIDKYDAWLFENYPAFKTSMRSYWKNSIQHLHHVAQQRNLPLICDEGYMIWPPTHSRFESSAIGKDFHTYIIQLMVRYGYWGIVISTYTFPSQPLWDKEPAFLRKLNALILGS